MSFTLFTTSLTLTLIHLIILIHRLVLNLLHLPHSHWLQIQQRFCQVPIQSDHKCYWPTRCLLSLLVLHCQLITMASIQTTWSWILHFSKYHQLIFQYLEHLIFWRLFHVILKKLKNKWKNTDKSRDFSD